MPLPTSYTEATFKAFLHAELRDVGLALGWSVAGGSYDEPLNDALFAYEADDIASVSGRDNLRKLRALGRVAVWRAVVNATSGDYDFAQPGGSRYDRSQVHQMAQDNLDRAVAEALVFSPEYLVGVATVVYEDYYTPPDLDDDQYARAG